MLKSKKQCKNAKEKNKAKMLRCKEAEKSARIQNQLKNAKM